MHQIIFFLKREKGNHTHKGMWAAPVAKLGATSSPTAHFVDGDLGRIPES
jgi:hypothetical protein